MEWKDWTAAIFVKAKEDFLGGNSMATNTEAKAYPVSYAINKGQPTELKRTYTAEEREELTMPLATPYVNVDNLKMNGNNTDFTVHVGTGVDPEAELTRLWNEIKINEVVKPNGADANYEMKDENQVFYSFDRQQNKITSDLLWEGGAPYDTIPLSHYVSMDVLNDLLDDVKGGATAKTVTSEPIVYAPYGSTNTAGYLTVTLKKRFTMPMIRQRTWLRKHIRLIIRGLLYMQRVTSRRLMSSQSNTHLTRPLNARQHLG